MSIEVCALVSVDGEVLWWDRSGGPAALPDSRSRWEAIWRYRDVLAEIAHTHPGGLLAFSDEDTTTMAAIDEGLGRPLCYAVVTADRMLRRTPDGAVRVVSDEPAWVAPLRAASGLDRAEEEEATWQS
jgi:hypothetical protein